MPITLVEVKDQLRIDNDFLDDDQFLDSLISVATARVEELTSRRLITQTWKVFFDDFPDGDVFEIPYGKLQSITHLKYTDTADAQTTWAATNYGTDTYSDPGRLVRKYGISWPTAALAVQNPIEIQFVCGYGVSGEHVPAPIRQAMLLLVGYLYENREAYVLQPGLTMVVSLPEAFYDLLNAYTIWSYHQ
jgi:uncharacterized phiE125 gp8 family phage protein